MNLLAAARQEMIDHGFDPDFPKGTGEQIAQIRAHPARDGARDLRQLPWSSIDNDTSRDLDQCEWAERAAGGIRVRVAIADVDCAVNPGTPIDRHACQQTTTVYTGVKNFSMLPEELSTGLTSLNEDQDRYSIVVEFVAAEDGTVTQPAIYRALIRNHAQLAYNATGAWLDGQADPPAKIARSPELQAQLRLQNEAASHLCEARHKRGALDFDRVEAEPVFSNGDVRDLKIRRRNSATRLIEDFMIAANEAMAQTLSRAGSSSIRRVVKTPERWPRIVALAAGHGAKLPAQPDAAALNGFLKNLRETDGDHYQDVSLAIIKLLGPGEYVFARPNQQPGHFALAVLDYTHSTAPNRRFSDLVTQRLIKAVLDGKAAPYTDSELEAIAANCTQKEDAARKVERKMAKRLAAAALSHRIGEIFAGVITGVTPKGTFVRILNPPAEGILLHAKGVDVGDRVQVKLIQADPGRGYIDFVKS
ncbi:MAG TPA: RNB domain-containing ribonuclease [Bryobacteraceae bacterium]|jgi:VacB/RNase II family 3'-5' exoribonuclease|nr:RNB domain-containing ribonuclease [Bryobacteraceae bacterium]